MITIRRITPQDAEVLRDVRLRALSDTPQAFGSTYAREVAFPPLEWETRAARLANASDATTFLALDEGECYGIIGCFFKTDEPGMATIVSMWVAPEARRKGVGARLIRAVEDWARQQRLSHLFLDVVENNAPAIAFYEKCGFQFTGETDQYPNDPSLRELFMLKRL